MTDFSKAFKINATTLDEVLTYINDFTLKVQAIVENELKHNIYHLSISKLDEFTIKNEIHPFNRNMKSSCLAETIDSLRHKFFNGDSNPYEVGLTIIKYQSDYYAIFQGTEKAFEFLKIQDWYESKNCSMHLLTDKVITLEEYQKRMRLWKDIVEEVDFNLCSLNKKVFNLDLYRYNKIVEQINNHDYLNYLSTKRDIFDSRIKQQTFFISLGTNEQTQKLRKEISFKQLHEWIQANLLSIDFNILSLSFTELEVLIKEHRLLNNTILMNDNETEKKNLKKI